MVNNIADVKGFKCWGAHIGIKSKRRDLALIFSTIPANAAAVFTKNVVVAEPLKISREHIKDGKLQAIVINSGNANACTGEQGYLGALKMAEVSAESLGVKIEDVLIGSTGVIGEPFPTEKVVQGIKVNTKKLSNTKVAGSLTANAILTTDTFAKEGFTSFRMGKSNINMAGIAKGSGMIHPNMATMFAFIVSDIAISSELLQIALKEVVDKSFNMITVDGDTSTNDMVVVMCNGKAGNKEINEKNQDYVKFKLHLEKLCTHLAKLIVTDGEGATKFIEYQVINANKYDDAKQIARTISNSNLVKTAIFGRDPNWGRIVAAAGRAGVNFDPNKINLYVGTHTDVQILKNGQPTEFDKSSLKRKMKSSLIKIIIDLNLGRYGAIAWGSDFSYDYVRINAEYTT